MSDKLKYIITLDEAIIDGLERDFAAHDKVRSTSQDSGFWYSNGETGPEWFTVHVYFLKNDEEAVRTHLEACLKKAGTSARLFLERDYS